jgi:CubicO group peptidase (beta-lactamase class C family)
LAQGSFVTSSDSDPSLDPVQRVLEKAVIRGAASGAVAPVGRGDNAHVLAIGTKTLGGTDPMRRDSLFRISSLTKPVTAAATMMLMPKNLLRSTPHKGDDDARQIFLV